MLEILSIEKDGDFLRKESNNLTDEELCDHDIQKLISDMIETLSKVEVIGLSACQVGVLKRIFVLYDGSVYINPRVIAKSGKITSVGEGCLSIPDKNYKLKRSRNIIIEYLDKNGTKCRNKFDKKLLSIAVQHELDHLDGILLCDK